MTGVRANSRPLIVSKIEAEFGSALTASAPSVALGVSSSSVRSGMKALIRSESQGQVSTGSKETTACFNRIYSEVPAAMAWKVASRKGHRSNGDCAEKQGLFSRATERQPSGPRRRRSEPPGCQSGGPWSGRFALPEIGSGRIQARRWRRGPHKP